MNEGPDSAPADPTRPDVKGAVARVRERRYKLSPEERRRERERKRAARDRAPEPAAERPPYVPDPSTVALAALLGRTVWKLTTLVTRHRELTDTEAEELGKALDPVLYKYLPLFEEWGAEINLVMVLYALWGATVPVPKPVEAASSVIE